MALLFWTPVKLVRAVVVIVGSLIAARVLRQTNTIQYAYDLVTYRVNDVVVAPTGGRDVFSARDVTSQIPAGSPSTSADPLGRLLREKPKPGTILRHNRTGNSIFNNTASAAVCKLTRNLKGLIILQRIITVSLLEAVGPRR